MQALFLQWRWLGAVGLCWWLAQPIAGVAHPEPDEQVQALNKRIERAPEDVDLLLRRAALFARTKRLDEALADYQTVAKLAPETPDLDLLQAKLLVRAGLPHTANQYLSRYLEQNPDDWTTRLARARVLAATGHPREGARDYWVVLQAMKHPTPDAYFEWAEMLQRSDEDVTEELLNGLSAGLEVLGPAASLTSLIMSIELEEGRYESALRRLDELLAQADRKDVLLKSKGDVLREMGSMQEARTAYQQAWDSNARLPDSLRDTTASERLRSELRTVLQEGGEL